MPYAITFLEGVISFISPCLLPMIPVFVMYFAGGDRSLSAFRGSLGFVLGFSIVFVALGALAGLIGGFFIRHQVIVNIVTGSVVVVFGLNYLGVLKIPFLNRVRAGRDVKVTGFFSAVLFGIVFAVGWTPCVGAFLGSALMKASASASAAEGMLLLLFYSLGLGLPFVISAVLIDNLKNAFEFVKRHYKTINIISGCFLCVIGVLMMTGVMGWFVAVLGGI